MLFNDINPYARFVRNQKQVSYKNYVCALDNRLFFCTGGNGKMLVDNDEISISKGTLLFIKSAVAYKYIQSERPLEFIACNFDFTFEHADKCIPIPPVEKCLFKPDLLIDNQVIEDEKMFDKYFVLCEANSFEEKFNRLKDEYNNRHQYYQRICSSVLSDIIITAARMYNIPEFAKDNIPRQVITYIKNNYKKSVTYSDIAKQFHYHPNYISRLMLKSTGMTLHKYLLSYRMSKAIALLQSTDYPIQKVAELVGMPDATHFSKCFKKHTGKAPTYYR